MVASGLCWSGFTLLGKQVNSPVIATKQGFIVASVMVFAFTILSQVLLALPSTFTAPGILYALLSGVIASARLLSLVPPTAKYRHIASVIDATERTCHCDVSRVGFACRSAVLPVVAGDCIDFVRHSPNDMG